MAESTSPALRHLTPDPVNFLNVGVATLDPEVDIRELADFLYQARHLPIGTPSSIGYIVNCRSLANPLTNASISLDKSRVVVVDEHGEVYLLNEETTDGQPPTISKIKPDISHIDEARQILDIFQNCGLSSYTSRMPHSDGVRLNVPNAVVPIAPGIERLLDLAAVRLTGSYQI